MKDVKQLIDKYINIESKVNNLVASNRLEAKTQASKASIELSDLHSEITEVFEAAFLYCNSENRNENRNQVSKVIGFYKTVIACGGTLDFSNLEEDMWNSLELEYRNVDGVNLSATIGSDLEKDNTLLFSMDGSFVMEQIETSLSFDTTRQAEKFTTDTTQPAENFASDSLKEMASKLGCDIVWFESGSYHTAWLNVALDIF